LTRPDLDRASALMKGRRPTVVMAIYKDCAPCSQEAEAVRAELGRSGIRVRIKEYENAFDAANKPGARIDMLDSEIELDYPDSASFLVRMFRDGTPASWLTAGLRRAVDRLARLSGIERQSAAATLADQLAVGAVPVIPYGNQVQGEFFATDLACRVFPPFSEGVDLAALCRS
jgi:ABC-type oligopeptide transport system substrate-binding subunit